MQPLELKRDWSFYAMVSQIKFMQQASYRHREMFPFTQLANMNQIYDEICLQYKQKLYNMQLQYYIIWTHATVG